ncbi:MAG: glutamate synthase subunit alpha, partial [Frankiaceae bacterium]
MSHTPARPQAYGPMSVGTSPPDQQGLYDPAYEHDSCGVAFVVDVRGRRSHDMVQKGLTALRNLDHRGAQGSDPDTGDGAGILMQMPDRFFREVVDFPLPPAGRYAAGIVFLPRESGARDEKLRSIARLVRQEKLTLLGWRSVPVVSEIVGRGSREVEPLMRQIFLGTPDGAGGLDLERRAFCLRRRLEREVRVYVASLSCRTIVYKGMLTTHQLSVYFPDLDDPRVETAIALVHSR